MIILPLPHCLFSLNNSETVKIVTLAFCSIQYYFNRNILAKFDISNSSQSPGIGQNSEGGIYDFPISGQPFINEICHNSRTSYDTDMKLGPVTNLDKKKMAVSKKLTMASCRQIVTLLSFFRFMANLQPSGRRVPDAWSIKLTFSLIITFYLTKTESRTKKNV